MVRMRAFPGLLALVLGATSAAAEPLKPELAQLLRDAEAPRELLSQGAQWTVEVGTGSGDKMRSRQVVKAEGSRALIEVLDPKASRGNRYLLASGEVWFYRAGGRRAVAISGREPVGGTAVVADMAASSHLEDYDIISATPGQALAGEFCAVFDLAAKPEARVGHPRVQLWVSEGARLVRQALFLTAAGRPVATASFRHEAGLMAGNRRVPMLSMITIRQEIGPRKVTVLRFSDYQLASFPEDTFDVAALAAHD